MRPFASLIGLLFAAVAGLPPAFAGELKIFDTHMHYSSSAWDVYSPAQILAKMDSAGVAWAMVSSTPDDGTLKLFGAAPGRIVPAFRPYRESADLGRWFAKPDLLAYSEARLAQGPYRAFGEVHIYAPENLETPQMARYLALLVERGLTLFPHADAAVVDRLFAKAPDLKIHWAHGGFSEPAAVIGGMLDQYPNLWTELSYRAQDIMPGDELDGEWKTLLIRHADRFMIGTDTWTVDRWHQYEGLIGEHRAWLKKLPPDVAEKIAHKNAERLFGP